jgi:hypothetical protein
LPQLRQDEPVQGPEDALPLPPKIMAKQRLAMLKKKKRNPAFFSFMPEFAQMFRLGDQFVGA